MLTTFFLAAAGRGRKASPFLLAVLLTSPAPVHAAGGHHAVDDAALLEPGQCQVEAWADRETGGQRSLSHLGPACRVGAVELGLGLDRTGAAGAAGATWASPQIKWAQAVDDRLSVGVAASTTVQDRSPHRLGSTLALLATWQPGATTLIHVNAGRDFRPGGMRSSHSGAAFEWNPTAAWSFVGERFREGGGDFWRAGARWTISSAVNADLSRAQGLQAGAPAWWTLGLTWVFER